MAKLTDKPEHPLTIQLRLFGGEVHPDSVPIGTLQELTEAIQCLSRTTLHLTRVRRGSANYQFAAEDAAIAVDGLTRSGAALTQPDQFLEYFMFAAFDALTAVAKRLKCRVQVRSSVGDVKWTVAPEQWREVRARSTMLDEAVVVGKLIRVGGATASKCAIRVPGRRNLLYCRLKSPGMARDLGRYIYKEVTLRGTALLVIKGFEILHFEVDDFHPIKHGTFREMYDAIRAAGGRAWDDIDDPIAELEGMR